MQLILILLEYAHFENAASAYFMAGDYGKSIQYSDKVIYEFQPKTGKSEYINALSHLNIGGQKELVNYYFNLQTMDILKLSLL